MRSFAIHDNAPEATDFNFANEESWHVESHRHHGVSLPAPNRGGRQTGAKTNVAPFRHHDLINRPKNNTASMDSKIDRNPHNQLATSSRRANCIPISQQRIPVLQCNNGNEIAPVTEAENAKTLSLFEALRDSPGHLVFLFQAEEFVEKRLGEQFLIEFYRGAHIIFNDYGEVYRTLFKIAKSYNLVAWENKKGRTKDKTPEDVMDLKTAFGTPLETLMTLGAVSGGQSLTLDHLHPPGALSVEERSSGKLVRRRPGEGETSHYSDTSPKTPQLGLDLPAAVGGHILFGIVPGDPPRTFVQTEGGGFQNFYQYIILHGLGALWNKIGGWQTGLIGYSTRSEKTGHGRTGNAIVQQMAPRSRYDNNPTPIYFTTGPPRASNRTGLPDQLKMGIEALSGISLDDVRVHYNSQRPAELGALAYAQGTEIHIAPGEERHLPHEAWHIVQQAQGRVRPTASLHGIAINNDPALEAEASQASASILLVQEEVDRSSSRSSHIPFADQRGTAGDRNYSWHFDRVAQFVKEGGIVRERDEIPVGKGFVTIAADAKNMGHTYIIGESSRGIWMYHFRADTKDSSQSASKLIYWSGKFERIKKEEGTGKGKDPGEFLIGRSMSFHELEVDQATLDKVENTCEGSLGGDQTFSLLLSNIRIGDNCFSKVYNILKSCGFTFSWSTYVYSFFSPRLALWAGAGFYLTASGEGASSSRDAATVRYSTYAGSSGGKPKAE